MTPWDLEGTRREIHRAHGRSQLDLAAPCLQSLADRQFYAGFHFQRANARLKRYVKKHLDPNDPMPTLFGQDEAGAARFNIVIRELAADVTACIQSIHALPDILASAVYFSLALNLVHKPEHGGFPSHDFVSKVLAGDHAYGAVGEGLRSIVRGSGYKHLAALANRSKHSSIVFPALNTDITGERPERHMLVLPAFKVRERQYPQVLVSEFLPPVFYQASKAILETGHALLAHLRSAA